MGASCAPECDTHTRPVEQPAYSEMDDTFVVVFSSKAIEPFGRGDILEKSRQLELGIAAAQIVACEARVGVHAAGKQPAAQRSIDQRGNAVAAAIWKHRFLDAALEQIVRWLHGMQRSNSAKHIHLCRTKVAYADRADFARAVKCRHRFRGFLDCRVGSGQWIW